MLLPYRAVMAAGAALFAAAPASSAFDSIVVFNEVHYNPGTAAMATPEFVELYNQNAVNIDMSGWRLTGGIDYTFPEGTVIDGRSYAVVSIDPTMISGALGPFVGALANGGETIRLRNNNRRIMDELSYDDRAPWPVGADGSGATLSKKDPMRSGAVPEHWTHSLEIGGTPGNVNFLEDVFDGRIENVALGKTVISGSSAYDNKAFNEVYSPTGDFRAQNVTDGSVSDEFGVNYWLGSNNDPSQDFTLDLGQSYNIRQIRLRNTHNAQFNDRGTLGFQILASNVVNASNQLFDPQAILIGSLSNVAGQDPIPAEIYTAANGLTEITARYLRFNSFSAINNDAGLNEIEVYTTRDPQLGFSGESQLWINEVGGTAGSSFWIELFNAGGGALDLEGYVLTFEDAGEYVFPAGQIIAAGGWLVVDSATLNLAMAPTDGENLYLYQPGKNELRDAVRIDDLSIARVPDGSKNIFGVGDPAEVSQGAANSVTVPNSIVINEIMYNHRPQYANVGDIPSTPYVENEEEWVELHNPTAAAVDISGWELYRAVDYEFPDGTSIPAGGYLVVPKDLSDFTAKFPTVTAVGGYSGSLSNRRERLILRDTFNNPVDEVAYFDGKPWPSSADGGGSSIELRHPEIDNSIPASWAASDNSATSSWQTYEYTLTAETPTYSPSQNGFHELRIGLLDAGEVLIDDVSVVEDPNGTNLELIANGSFANAAGWRLLGTHQDSEVVSDAGDSVLKVVAADRFNYLNNLIEVNLTNGGALRPVVSGRSYKVSFRAKWLSGSPQFRFELYYNKLAKLVVLDQPAAHGTPGAQNSTYSATLGPDLSGLLHSPPVPSAGDPVVVSVDAADPNGLGSLSLRYSVNAGAFQNVAMSVGADGRHQATIPAQSGGSKVQFYVRAMDGSGNVSFAPPLGPDSRAIVEFDNAIGGGTKQSIRINMLSSDSNALHSPDLLLDNKPKGCTIIVDEETIAYDGAMRLRGSMFSRRNASTTGLNIKFPADRRFRDIHSSVHVKRGDLREILVKHIINAAGGLHDSYNDIAILDGHISGQSGVVRLEMARFGRNYLRGLPGGDGTDGTVFKMEGIRVFEKTQDDTRDSPKIPFPIDWVSEFDLADQGDDQEVYRHNIRINSGLDRDDYSGAMAMCKLFSLEGQALEDAAPSVIDVDVWTRKFAMLALCGITDTYSQGNPHNCNFYAGPDGLVVPIPWDWDHTFALSTTASLFGDRNVAKLFARPVYRRLYYGHLHDIVTTTFNSSYISTWASHLGSCAGENYGTSVSYINNRSNYALSQLPSNVPFIITTNGGSNFSTNGSTVTLSGNGWINVREFMISGFSDPFVPTWTGADGWEINVPVAPGANELVVTAIDHQGGVVGSDAITVTSNSSVELASSSNLVVSEINYHPEVNSDEEFIELQNIHPSATIDLSGVVFTDGIEFEFPAGMELASGARILVVRDPVAFGAAYGAGLPIAGSFANLSALSNSGEMIVLEAPGGAVIRAFTYDDKFPWPESPDGEGASLVLVNPISDPDHAVAANWRPSVAAGGNPGASDATTFPGGDLLSYAFAGESATLEFDADGHVLFSFPRNLAADDISYAIQTSTDMVQWDDGGMVFMGHSITDLGTGFAIMSFRSENPMSAVGNRIFARIMISGRIICEACDK